MRAAYDALDEETRREVEDLVCEHSLMYSRGSLGFLDYSEEEKAMFKPVRQRLVRSHPVTGRKSLYLSSHAGGILGMPMPEARMLLRDLNEHATQPKFVYVHKWTLHDLVIWDNRQVMHRVRRYDDFAAARHAPHDRRGQRADGSSAGRGVGGARRRSRYWRQCLVEASHAGCWRSLAATGPAIQIALRALVRARRARSAPPFKPQREVRRRTSAAPVCRGSRCGERCPGPCPASSTRIDRWPMPARCSRHEHLGHGRRRADGEPVGGETAELLAPTGAFGIERQALEAPREIGLVLLNQERCHAANRSLVVGGATDLEQTADVPARRQSGSLGPTYMSPSAPELIDAGDRDQQPAVAELRGPGDGRLDLRADDDGRVRLLQRPRADRGIAELPMTSLVRDVVLAPQAPDNADRPR